MSNWDEKTEAQGPSDGNRARRPLKSFIRAPGYEFRILEERRSRGIVHPVLLSYREADERTFWRRVEGLDGDWFELIPERTQKAGRGG